MLIRSTVGFNCTDEENTAALASLRKRAWLAFKDKIMEQTVDATMLIKLKLFFEDRFRYDEAGVPRVWKPADDIDALFRKAKEEVRQAIYSMSISDIMMLADSCFNSSVLADQAIG